MQNKRTIPKKLGLAVVAASALVLSIATPASAATTFSSTALGVTVSGTKVTAKTTIKASINTKTNYSGICARDAAGKDVDFPLNQGQTIAKTGTTIEKTQTLAPGNYTYWSCVSTNGSWPSFSAKKTFTVKATTTPTSTTTKAPVGDLTSWDQILVEDFTTSAAAGNFTGYNNQWMTYDGFADTYKNGLYNEDTLSVHDGVLDMNIKTINGSPSTAAPVPLVNGEWGGQTYGRYSVRMKSDALAGYKTAFLLWSDDNDWNKGEVDFPEGELNGKVSAFNHVINNPSQNSTVINTNASYTDWHVYTIDWTPKKITFYVDGVEVGSDTNNIPNTPMHWVMQVETTESKPASSTQGHLLIDWATIYNYKG